MGMEMGDGTNTVNHSRAFILNSFQEPLGFGLRIFACFWGFH